MFRVLVLFFMSLFLLSDMPLYGKASTKIWCSIVTDEELDEKNAAALLIGSIENDFNAKASDSGETLFDWLFKQIDKQNSDFSPKEGGEDDEYNGYDSFEDRRMIAIVFGHCIELFIEHFAAQPEMIKAFKFKYGNSLLHLAAKAGFLNALEKSFPFFEDCVDILNERGETPLMLAAASDIIDDKVIEFFVDKRADINALRVRNGAEENVDLPPNVLGYAVRGGECNLEIFLDAGPALLYGNSEGLEVSIFNWMLAKGLLSFEPMIYKILLEHFLKIAPDQQQSILNNLSQKEKNYLFAFALTTSHLRFMQYWVDNNGISSDLVLTPLKKLDSGSTLLHYAAEYGMFPIVGYLLAADRKIINARDAAGNTPLFRALGFGKRQGSLPKKEGNRCELETIKCFLRHGAEVWLENLSQSALSLAIKHSSEEVVKELMWHIQALPSDKQRKYLSAKNCDDNHTLLWSFLEEGYFDLADLLLESPEVFSLDLFYDRDDAGLRLLHLACKRGAVSIARKLCDLARSRGCLSQVVNAKTFNGSTPLGYAINQGSVLLVELLLNTKEISFEELSSVQFNIGTLQDAHYPILRLFEDIYGIIPTLSFSSDSKSCSYREHIGCLQAKAEDPTYRNFRKEGNKAAVVALEKVLKQFPDICKAVVSRSCPALTFMLNKKYCTVDEPAIDNGGNEKTALSFALVALKKDLLAQECFKKFGVYLGPLRMVHMLLKKGASLEHPSVQAALPRDPGLFSEVVEAICKIALDEKHADADKKASEDIIKQDAASSFDLPVEHRPSLPVLSKKKKQKKALNLSTCHEALKIDPLTEPIQISELPQSNEIQDATKKESPSAVHQLPSPLDQAFSTLSMSPSMQPHDSSLVALLSPIPVKNHAMLDEKKQEIISSASNSKLQKNSTATQPKSKILSIKPPATEKQIFQDLPPREVEVPLTPGRQSRAKYSVTRDSLGQGPLLELNGAGLEGYFDWIVQHDRSEEGQSWLAGAYKSELTRLAPFMLDQRVVEKLAWNIRVARFEDLSDTMLNHAVTTEFLMQVLRMGSFYLELCLPTAKNAHFEFKLLVVAQVTRELTGKLTQLGCPSPNYVTLAFALNDAGSISKCMHFCCQQNHPLFVEQESGVKSYLLAPVRVTASLIPGGNLRLQFADELVLQGTKNYLLRLYDFIKEDDFEALEDNYELLKQVNNQKTG